MEQEQKHGIGGPFDWVSFFGNLRFLLGSQSDRDFSRVTETTQMPGWEIDPSAITNDDLYELFHKSATVFVLKPKEWLNPFGDAMKATLQYEQWKQELHVTSEDPMVVLAVLERNENEDHWVVAPLLRSDLECMTPDELMDYWRNRSALGDFIENQLRVLINVRTNMSPEMLALDKH
jgi:hypothetical protein